MAQKILVAFDDSENAMRAVEFIAKALTKEQDITLFSVIPDTASICDMNSPSLTPYFISKQAIFCTLEDQKKDLLNKALQKAREVLLKGGFKEENITVKAHPKKIGVARDIIKEANSGYDAIVLGRRGISGVKEFILGSVSQKVLHMARGVSVILVD